MQAPNDLYGLDGYEDMPDDGIPLENIIQNMTASHPDSQKLFSPSYGMYRAEIIRSIIPTKLIRKWTNQFEIYIYS